MKPTGVLALFSVWFLLAFCVTLLGTIFYAGGPEFSINMNVQGEFYSELFMLIIGVGWSPYIVKEIKEA